MNWWRRRECRPTHIGGSDIDPKQLGNISFVLEAVGHLFIPPVEAGKLIFLNPNDRILYVGNRTVQFDRREFEVLSLLMKHRNNVVTDDEFAEIWEGKKGNSLAVTINRIRKKLDRLGTDNPFYITTSGPDGYILSLK